MKITKTLMVLTIVTTAGMLFLALLWWPEGNTDADNEFLDDFGGLEVKSIISESPDVISSSQNSTKTGIPFRRSSLKVGDRFPFRKTIIQRVSQDRLNGTYQSMTTIEIELNLRVVGLLPDDTIHWSVDFPKVKYRREQPEGIVEYDSTISSGTHPPEANMYVGLTYSGFHFRQNTRDGSFKIDNLDLFLKRILRFVPLIEQNVLMKNYRNQTPENLVALFTDDSLNHSIFMLNKETGDTIERIKENFDPVPFRQRTVFKISARQNRKTTVEIRGMVIPDSSRSSRLQNVLQCSIIGGHAEGFCVIDNASGLPEKKQVHREITMKVSLPDGGRFFQTQSCDKGFEMLPSQNRIAKIQ